MTGVDIWPSQRINVNFFSLVFLEGVSSAEINSPVYVSQKSLSR